MVGAVRVGVLGPVELVVDDRVVALSPLQRALVAALVVDEGRTVSADELARRLWGEDVPRAAVTLQSYVARLRARIDDVAGRTVAKEVLRTRAPGYQLVLGEDDVDAHRFRTVVRRARADPDPASARVALRGAVELWRGTAYADVEQPFARSEAERLAGHLLQARELAAEVDLDLGRHQEALEDLAVLVQQEPLRESLWASYVLALYRSGRQADALGALARAREVLRDELGVDPGPELRRLHEQVLRHDPSLAAPHPPPHQPSPEATGGERAADPAPTGPAARTGHASAALSVSPSRLIGRAEDLDELAGYVGDGTRLLTLTGIGGVGKTRLAAALADRLAPDFGDGVVLVALATTEEPGLVVPTIARALGHDGDPGSAGVDGLARLLAGQRLLVVLDNLEHLLAAAGDIARLVAALPELVVVVTSRAPMRVSFEQEWLVRPLAVHAAEGRPVTLGEARESPAVDLFVRRGRAVAPAFRLDGDNAATVVEICRRLGGIPLAIELAVARLRVFGPEALLARLEDAPYEGPRDLPPRQRTMRATLDWSYGLLDEEAQALYRALSVFSGGWTLPALQSLLGPEIHHTLETLVEHSLVTISWGGRDTRYGMLEPAAQHARSMLTDEEAQRVSAAHAAHFVDLAEAASLGFLGAEQLDWLAVMDYEHANVLRALDWAGGHGYDDNGRDVAGHDAAGHDVAGRIVWAMWLYWWWRSYTTLGRRAVATVLERAELAPAVRLRAELAGAALAFSQSDLEAAQAGYGEVARRARLADDVEPLANATAGLGIVALARGEVAEAADLQRVAIAEGERLHGAGYGSWIVSLGHCWLGTALLALGEREEALDHLNRGLELARACGDRLAAYTTLWYLARSEAGRDDAAARAHLVEGLRLARDVGDLTNLSYFIDALVAVESAAATAATAANAPDVDAANAAAGLTAPAAERHARLLGAAEAFREAEAARAISYYQPDDEARDEAAQRARDALGATTYAQRHAEGRHLSLDDALNSALDVPPGPSHGATTAPV